MKFSMAGRLSLAIAGLLMAATARAQAPAGGPGFGEHHPPFERALGPQGNHGRWWNNPAMQEKLKLSDAQRKSMDDILLQHRENLVDLRGSVEKSELELEPLMQDDQPNEAKVLAQIDKVAQARAELEKGNARFLLAIRGKLTPEQWKLLQAERANHHADRRGWEPGSHMMGGRMQGGRGHRQAPPPGQQGMEQEGSSPEAPVAPGGGTSPN